MPAAPGNTAAAAADSGDWTFATVLVVAQQRRLLVDPATRNCFLSPPGQLLCTGAAAQLVGEKYPHAAVAAVHLAGVHQAWQQHPGIGAGSASMSHLACTLADWMPCGLGPMGQLVQMVSSGSEVLPVDFHYHRGEGE